MPASFLPHPLHLQSGVTQYFLPDEHHGLGSGKVFSHGAKRHYPAVQGICARIKTLKTPPFFAHFLLLLHSTPVTRMISHTKRVRNQEVIEPEAALKRPRLVSVKRPQNIRPSSSSSTSSTSVQSTSAPRIVDIMDGRTLVRELQTQINTLICTFTHPDVDLRARSLLKIRGTVDQIFVTQRILHRYEPTWWRSQIAQACAFIRDAFDETSTTHVPRRGYYSPADRRGCEDQDFEEDFSLSDISDEEEEDEEEEENDERARHAPWRRKATREEGKEEKRESQQRGDNDTPPPHQATYLMSPLRRSRSGGGGRKKGILKDTRKNSMRHPILISWTNLLGQDNIFRSKLGSTSSPVIFIGRERTCDVVLPATLVTASRLHAILVAVPKHDMLVWIDVSTFGAIPLRIGTCLDKLATSRASERSCLFFRWKQAARIQIAILGEPAKIKHAGESYVPVILDIWPRLCDFCDRGLPKHRLWPCGHRVACDNCVKEINYLRCPRCGDEIDDPL